MADSSSEDTPVPDNVTALRPAGAGHTADAISHESYSSSQILTERRDGVLVLTLNRPDRLNAWTRVMEREYFDLLTTADDDPLVRAIVVTGAGRGFCSGADLDGLARASSDNYEHGDRPLSFPLSLRKPVIAAINGPAAGIGLAVALYADLRFAAEDAKLTAAFSQRGLIAEYGVSWLLPRLVGPSSALDLLLSSRVVHGDEAQRMGLIDRLTPTGAVLPAALDYAGVLARDCSPASMADIKSQVYDGLHEDLATATSKANDLMITAFDRADAQEGIQSYHERRPAEFPPLPPRAE